MQFFVQIRLKMEAGDCPPLNINAMPVISVKSYLNSVFPLRLSVYEMANAQMLLSQVVFVYQSVNYSSSFIVILI